MTIKTNIHALKKIKKGAYVGYGCTFRAPKDMTIASLPVGYFEGFLRIAGQRGAYVLIDGCRCKVVGTISMNIMMVDVTDIPGVEPGMSVTLVGNSGTENLSVEQWSDWSGTIPYEFCSRLHPNIPRIY
jgi:alanine racemase